MALATFLAGGCAMTDTTNLTPRRVVLDPGGFYHFETQWSSNRRGVGTNVQAYVVIETELYPMSPVAFAKDRFEAFVPLPPGKTYIPYRYRFDFQYPGSFSTEKNSDLSPSYRLIVPRENDQPIQTTQPLQK